MAIEGDRMEAGIMDMSAPLRAPEGTAFYRPPQPLPDGEHGDLIWSRPLTGPAALAQAATSELVLYRSTGLDGSAIGVSGIVALPAAEPPQGGFPVVSWAHGTMGSADVCAPSRDSIDSPAHIYAAAPHRLLNAFLERGWAVVMTDYEGLGTPGPHPYLVGLSEARAILDIARAGRALYPQLSKRLAVVGHSQGGQAALFAAHHKDWTPELQLCGAAAIAPPSAIKTLLSSGIGLPKADPGFAFTALFLTGAIAADPSIDPAKVLTDGAYALWPHVEQRCRVGLSAPDSWGGLMGVNQLRQPFGPHTTKFFDQLDAMHPDLDIAVPIRMVQAVKDERVRAALTTALVEQLRTRNGAGNVGYELYAEVDATEHPAELGFHFGTMYTDIGAMTTWLTDRFSAT